LSVCCTPDPAPFTSELIGKERQDLANTPTNKNKKRSAATVNRYLSSLSALFSHALSLRWIDENPCFRLTKLKENPGRDRVLSEDEISRLLNVCRQSKSPYLYCFVLMSLTTGARQGEILGLEWRHVDFENRLAYLKETKNGRPRSISLADSVLDALLLLYQKTESYKTISLCQQNRLRQG
jgi:integrase